MKKQVSKAFGKKIYLLGVGIDGKNYWLEAPSWDCGWYWGFGYVETYTNNKRPDLSRDILSHQHFEGLFSRSNKNTYDALKDFFSALTLTDDEIWKLCDYMKTFYTLRETAEVFGRGYSYYTERAKLEIVKNLDMVKTINEIMLPSIFTEIEKLFTGTNNE
jgi:hypothetical protein